MNKKDIENLNGVKFVVTENMRKLTIDMLVKQQMLDEMELTPKQRKLLEKELAKIRYQFIKELQERNPIQTIIMRNYLNNENEIDK